jgi:hypothetical protein
MIIPKCLRLGSSTCSPPPNRAEDCVWSVQTTDRESACETTRRTTHRAASPPTPRRSATQLTGTTSTWRRPHLPGPQADPAPPPTRGGRRATNDELRLSSPQLGRSRRWIRPNGRFRRSCSRNSFDFGYCVVPATRVGVSDACASNGSCEKSVTETLLSNHGRPPLLRGVAT